MTANHQMPEGAVADSAGNWVDRWAPTSTRPYFRLSRADRPIGTWLLYLPCLWALSLAILADGHASMFDMWLMVSAGIGAFLMRADLPSLGDCTRLFIRHPCGDLSVCQAVHMVATSIPWDRVQLGRVAYLGRTYRINRICPHFVIRGRHFLDPVL